MEFEITPDDVVSCFGLHFSTNINYEQANHIYNEYIQEEAEEIGFACIDGSDTITGQTEIALEEIKLIIEENWKQIKTILNLKDF